MVRHLRGVQQFVELVVSLVREPLAGYGVRRTVRFQALGREPSHLTPRGHVHELIHHPGHLPEMVDAEIPLRRLDVREALIRVRMEESLGPVASGGRGRFLCDRHSGGCMEPLCPGEQGARFEQGCR